MTDPRPTMGPGENVDSRRLESPLWRFYGVTFSITYSVGKTAQTSIGKPIHPLLNKKMLAHLSAEIILSVQQSELRLRLAVLNEMGVDRSYD